MRSGSVIFDHFVFDIPLAFVLSTIFPAIFHGLRKDYEEVGIETAEVLGLEFISGSPFQTNGSECMGQTLASKL